MRRTVLFGVFALAVMLTWNASSAYGQGSVAYPLGRVLFTINLPYEVDAAGVLIPPGDYVIRDLGVQSQNLLSITCRDEFEAVAILHTTRRQLVAGREEHHDPKLVFDEENPARPILREITVPGLDDYIVVAAVATDKSNCACCAAPAPSRLTVKQTTVVEEKPAPPPPPAPEAPAPQPEAKPQPQPQPEAPPPPVPQRPRVRKN